MLCLLWSSTGVLAGSGIEVVGPVFPDESTEQAPSLHHVATLLREGGGSGSTGGSGSGVSGGVLPELQACGSTTTSTVW